jgi:hypothetical protein
VTARRDALETFYTSSSALEAELGGARRLRDCHGHMPWPSHGVYLFLEPGELREDGHTGRVVRVGTHALTARSKTTLWQRLSQHRGNVGGANPGGGNHRGSVFRLHVGTALIARDGWDAAAHTWGQGSSAPREVRDRELALEREVSRKIGAMPLIWLSVPERDDRGPIERDLIALLSNAVQDPVDGASPGWLGHHADRTAIRESGLWNVNHTHDTFTGHGLEQF